VPAAPSVAFNKGAYRQQVASLPICNRSPWNRIKESELVWLGRLPERQGTLKILIGDVEFTWAPGGIALGNAKAKLVDRQIDDA
jgi:hypothetical protein